MFFDEDQDSSHHAYEVVFELDMEIRSVAETIVDVLSDVVRFAVVTAAGANVSQGDVSLMLTDAGLLTSRTTRAFDAHIVVQKGFSTGSEAQRFAQDLAHALAQRRAEAWKASLVAAAQALEHGAAKVSSFDAVVIQSVDSEASVVSPPWARRPPAPTPRPPVAGPAEGALAVGPLAGAVVVPEGRSRPGVG